MKNFNSDQLITLLQSFFIFLDLVDLSVLLDISFIRFGSLTAKLQSFFRDVFVLKVCKLRGCLFYESNESMSLGLSQSDLSHFTL